MKKNMLTGICTAAVCIALSTFASTNNAQAASINPNETTISTHYFQDSTSMRRGSGSGNKMGSKGKMSGSRMNSDSTGKMGNMKGKNSGGYKSKGMGKSKMDTTSNK